MCCARCAWVCVHVLIITNEHKLLNQFICDRNWEWKICARLRGGKSFCGWAPANAQKQLCRDSNNNSSFRCEVCSWRLTTYCGAFFVLVVVYTTSVDHFFRIDLINCLPINATAGVQMLSFKLIFLPLADEILCVYFFLSPTHFLARQNWSDNAQPDDKTIVIKRTCAIYVDSIGFWINMCVLAKANARLWEERDG